MRNVIFATTLAVLAALVAMPAEAASRSTAHASGNIPVRDGPGFDYAVIGTLEKGINVHLQRCTRDSGWCLILNKHGEPGGWVRGSYLVGSGAKLEVTPRKFLTFDPMDPLGFCDDDDDEGDWDDSDPYCDQ